MWLIKIIVEKAVRRAFTAWGGSLYATGEQVSQVVGAVIVLIDVIWAVAEKKQRSESGKTTLGSTIASKLPVAIPFLALLLFTGCVKTQLVNPHGVSITRTAFGLNTSVGSFSLSSETNGASKITLDGYQSEGVQTIEAVARGVATGLKPVP